MGLGLSSPSGVSAASNDHNQSHSESIHRTHFTLHISQQNYAQHFRFRFNINCVHISDRKRLSISSALTILFRHALENFIKI